MIRSSVILIAFLCGLTIIATTGCTPQNAGVDDTKMVQIGTTKADLFGIPAEYRALHVRLEKCFDEPVRFSPQPDGPAIAQQLALGNLSYAILSSAEYAQIEDAGKLTPLACGVNKLGRTTRKAFIVSRAATGAKTVAECKGKRFAFGTRDDMLTDFAVRQALEDAGLPVQDLFPDVLTPPPLAYEGRLYLKEDAAKTLLVDLTIEAAVVDEGVYEAMPDTGGNFITGPSKDQFRILAETTAVPELLVVAGPSADAALTDKLKDELLNKVKDDPNACRQLGITGFAPPDPAVYDALRALVVKPK